MSERMHPALGVVEVDGYVAMAAAVEAMSKASDVTFIGFQRTGGYTMTALVSGEISSVEYALNAGVQAAEEAKAAVKTSILVNVDDDVERIVEETMGIRRLDLRVGQ